MHAAVGVFKMDPALYDEQRKTLEARIIPSVKAHAGFVAGYWSYDHATSKSHSYIVLDSEESARALIGFVKASSANQSAHGVTLESITVVEVLGEARLA